MLLAYFLKEHIHLNRNGQPDSFELQKASRENVLITIKLAS